jgi:two-component system sensor histidine kinase BaeS
MGEAAPAPAEDRRRSRPWGRRLDRLGARLVVAFLAVAVGAVAVLAGLVFEEARRDVSRLVRAEQDSAADVAAVAAAAAYREAGGWAGADLRSALAAAGDLGGTVAVLDAGGVPVAGPVPPAPSGAVRQRAVVVDGRPVGRVRLVFSSTSLPPGPRHLRDALSRTVAGGAALAGLLAVVAAVFVSRRLTRPLRRLIATARAMEAGDRTVRVGDVRAPGELGELAAAFDGMADAVDREDRLRRGLVADVAHELRTPLALLQGTLEAMTDGVVEATPSQLSALHDDVLRLGRIVTDLEALASAEAASVRLELRPVDLGEVAAQRLSSLRPHFEAAALQVDTALAPVVVDADPQRLGQVVTNLLTNALKYTPPGGRVEVRVTTDRDTAQLTVRDNGPGIPPDELPHVFRRFWRGDAGRNVTGSGIGLTVVAELIRAHRGTVEVESPAGGGTSVVVTLPSAGVRSMPAAEAGGAPSST